MSDLTAAVEAAKAVSEWLVYQAEDGENAIRRATTDEILERRIAAAAPLIEAAARADERAKTAEDVAKAIAATCLQVTWPDGRTSLKLAEVMDAARDHYEAIARQHTQETP